MNQQFRIPPRIHPYFLLFLLLPVLLMPASAFAQGNLKEVPPTDPQYELERLNIAEGYELNLFASDPMIEKPIQMTWDERGRLWIVGSAIYPHLLPGQEPDDKIFILEDTDGDGQADKSTVFADGLLTPTGLLIGDGGAYVANSTELLHLRDLDGDGYAEDRRVVLRGFGADDTHHIIHSFRWGPDGLMYINQSIYIYSHIETPWGIRRLRQGGIWHFRPDNMKLEVFARGFYNAWGHSFDEWGQSFVTDGAGYRGINHVFPEAAFEATYRAERILPGLNDGQPKHSGLAIVSGRHLPDSLQGHLITNDFRANRVNRFVITDENNGDKNDGFTSTAASDLIWSDHVAFRPVDVSVGPDGALYLADWYNPIIQHGEVDFRDPRRDHVHGRIWRVTAKDRPTVEIPDLAGASTEALLDMLRLPELWTRQQARRLLKEKGAESVLPALTKWVTELSTEESDYEQLRLEGLWLHQALDVVNEDLLAGVLQSTDYRVRAAAVRVLYHWIDRVASAELMLAAAIEDDAMRVRREALSALTLLNTASAAQIAMKAMNAPMSEEVDYALWYAIRALAPHWADQLDADPDYFGPNQDARLFAWKATHTPEAIDHLMAIYLEDTLDKEEAGDILDLIIQYGDEAELQEILEITLSGNALNGLDRETHLKALTRAASTFGKQPETNAEAIATLLDDEEEAIQQQAIDVAGYWKLESLIDDIIEIGTTTSNTDLQQAAFTAAARINDTALKGLIESSEPAALRVQAAAAYLASSPEEAIPMVVELLQAVDEKTDVSPMFSAIYRSGDNKQAFAEAIQTTPIPAHFATVGLKNYRGNRQRDAAFLNALVASGGEEVQQRLSLNMSAWNMDRLELDIKSGGDPVAGEDVYRRPGLACMRCHAIGGAGGLVGPDLSSVGANAPTDYIIESLFEPERAVKDGYALTSITRTDGQVVRGTLIRDTGTSVLLRDASNTVVTVPNNLIASQEILPGSLMPAGLIASLTRDEFVDLASFLSKLGETGDFRVPATQYVRNWQMTPLPSQDMPSPDEIADLISGAGQTLYSRVDGSLQMKDLPGSAETQTMSLLWFYINVESAGDVRLQVNSNLGLRFSVGDKMLPADNKTADGEIHISLPPGNHPVAVVLNRDERGTLPLYIELRQADSSARVQLSQRNTDD